MGEELPAGCKPFVDDGNTFYALAGIPAITHGPDAKGAHTVEEEVPVAELVRVAQVYALTAIAFCSDLIRCELLDDVTVASGNPPVHRESNRQQHRRRHW